VKDEARLTMVSFLRMNAGAPDPEKRLVAPVGINARYETSPAMPAVDGLGVILTARKPGRSSNMPGRGSTDNGSTR